MTIHPEINTNRSYFILFSWFQSLMIYILGKEKFGLLALISLAVFENLSLSDFPISHILTAQKLLKLRLLEDFISISESIAYSSFDPHLNCQQFQQLHKYQKRWSAFSILEIVFDKIIITSKVEFDVLY
jgi:hypothetical protein